jgi:small subunit ribosomal protein S1
MSEQNFEELLENSFAQLDAEFYPGDRVNAHYISTDGDHVFFDIGGKSEAVAETQEFTEQNIDFSDTKTIELYIADSSRASEILATSAIGLGIVSDALLKRAQSDELTVYGTVTEEREKGYTVSIGDMKCFCPKSHISQKTVEAQKGKKIPFLIMPDKPGERKRKSFIVSNKLIQEKETKKLAESLKDTITAGDRFKGAVTRIEDYGIFLKLDNGLEGLVPRSELSRSRQVKSSDFTIGQEVEAEILSLDWANSKHSFSIKNTTVDPWEINLPFGEGQEVEGKVANIIRDGAFVELAPGIEGFIHKSNLSKIKKVNSPSDVLSKGETVSVEILSVDQGRRRIGLALQDGEADPWKDSSVTEDTIVSAKVEEIKQNGLICRSDKGMEIFVPLSETPERNLSSFTVDSPLEVLIIEKDSKRKRSVGSIKRIGEKKEQEELNNFINKQEDASNTSSLGAMFGDVLKNLKEDVK